MSKVSDEQDDAAETLYDRLLPLMQADEPDVYGRKVRAQEAIRAALEAVSSIHEADHPVAWVMEPSGLAVATIVHDDFSLVEIVKSPRTGAARLLTIHRTNEETGRRDDMSIDLTEDQAKTVAAALLAHPDPISKGVTDEQVIAVATLYGNYIPGHGWTGFGPSPEQINSCLSHTAGEIEAGGEVERLKTLNANLVMQAQGHAMEARTANSTIYEIYQVLSGATGEPGNWHGAGPAREYVAKTDKRIAELEAALEMIAGIRPCLDNLMGNAGIAAAALKEQLP